jgi:PAS domain S-box-containing protein
VKSKSQPQTVTSDPSGQPGGKAAPRLPEAPEKRKWAWRYNLALVAVAAGFGLRMALTAWTGPGLPTYITFYPAVMVAALLAGFGPGVLATVLTELTTAYWILPPEGFGIASPVDRVGMALFAGMGLFMSAVAELHRRDRRKAAAYDQEAALRETRREKEFLANVLERASQPFAVGYPDGRLGRCNRSYEQLTGYRTGELRAIDWVTTLTPPEWRELERQKLEELRLGGDPVRYEKEYVRKDGTRVPIELLVHLVKDAAGRPEYYYSFLTDISQRKQKETELRRLNRTLDALRHSSEAMMRAESEADYLARVCRIITDDCGHAMVWIGYAEEDEAKTVRPVAHAGFDEGYLKALHVTWADNERGRGPTGTAIRTGKPDGCQNMLTDPRFAPWREAAIQRGYASSIVLPLQTTGAAFGAVNIYSRTPGVFSEHEIKLLMELADDLAYGITALRLREAHARAERALRQSEERNREELERRVAERTAELEAAGRRREITHALLELFAHKSSGKEYFDAVVEVIRNWTGCQCLGVRVLDEQGGIPYSASVGFDAAFLKLENHLSVKTDTCFCIRAISQSMDEQDRPLMTSAGSLRCDNTPDFMRQMAPGKRGRYRGSCVKWGFKSIAVIPIRYRDQVLGAVHLADSRPNHFPPATVEFLESMAPLMGEAIQRFHAEAELSRHRDHLEELVKQRTAELETANRQLQAAEADLHRERDQLEIRVNARTADLSAANRALQAEMVQRQHAEQEHKKLLRRLADAQESERARISRELHDQLGQELTALKLGLRLVKNQGASVPAVRESVGKLEHLAGGLMQAIHRLAWELHPAVLDDLGLEAALRRYTSEWSESNQVPVDFHATGMDNGRLPLDLETALYRVTQEALTNVLRHAKARHVGVLLERRADLISVIIEDDGAGFDAGAVFQTARSRGKLGLLGMRERIAMAGGSIEIESTPGAGTTVFARVRLAAGNPAES